MKAADFAVSAPSNSQAIFLAPPAKVDAATGYSTTSPVPSGAVRQTAEGRQNLVLLMFSGTTNLTVTPVGAVTSIGWTPYTDANSNVWRRVAKEFQPRYVMNLGTGIVYVATGKTKAADGVGIPLLPGTAPYYFGGVVSFVPGEGQHGITAWTAAGGRVGYGED